MTNENRLANISEEFVKAVRTREESELLFRGGFYAGAISRLYYFLLSMVRALLLTKGIEPRSHEGASRLLGMHFIKPGALPTDVTHVFSRMMKYREEADYNPSYVISEEDFRKFRDEVSCASATIEEYLRGNGFLKG